MGARLRRVGQLVLRARDGFDALWQRIPVEVRPKRKVVVQFVSAALLWTLLKVGVHVDAALSGYVSIAAAAFAAWLFKDSPADTR